MNMTNTMIRTYSELINLETFDERFKYLMLNGRVAKETFGYDRYINQKFYKSKEWMDVRDYVIIRDNGFDLGVLDKPIDSRIIVHHMNPITKNDILKCSDILLDPEFLISTSKRTHDAIHYGSLNPEFTSLNERFQNDTCPWKR